MKKLYVLVFLVMFMSDLSAIPETITDIKVIESGWVFDIYPKETYLQEVSISERGGIWERKVTPEAVTKIKAGVEKYKSDLTSIKEFFKANSIKIPTLELSDLKGNPWSTLAPRIFADQTGLTESDLKPFFLRNIGKTPEQKFILNLQKELIKKIISESTKPENITKLLEILVLSNSSLPVGIGKTTVELLDSVNSSFLQGSEDKRSVFDQFRITFLSKEAAKAAVANAEKVLLEASIVADKAEKAAKKATEEAITKKAAKEEAEIIADSSAKAKKQRDRTKTTDILNQGYNQTEDSNDAFKQNELAKAKTEHEAAQQAKIRADSAHAVAQEALRQAKQEHKVADQQRLAAQETVDRRL